MNKTKDDDDTHYHQRMFDEQSGYNEGKNHHFYSGIDCDTFYFDE